MHETASRPLINTRDQDGVDNWGPVPKGTLWSLLRRKFTLPPPQYTAEPTVIEKPGLVHKLDFLLHKFRKLHPESISNMEQFKQTAEKYGREITFAVLTGRGTHLHEMIKVNLTKSGRSVYFSELFLNTGKSSSGWKETKARELVAEGKTVIHLEDDLKAALMVARVATDEEKPETIVYLFRNLSNHKRLLKWAKVEIPQNVIFVDSFAEVITDFDNRLSMGLVA